MSPMIRFNDLLVKELSKRENTQSFVDAAVHEYLVDGNVEMFLLTINYLIEIYKKPLDKK